MIIITISYNDDNCENTNKTVYVSMNVLSAASILTHLSFGSHKFYLVTLNFMPHPLSPPSVSHLAFLSHPVVIYCIYLEAVFYEYCSLSINLIKLYLQGNYTFTFVDNFNISLAPRKRDSILTNKQLKCAIAMLCTAMSLF